MSDFDFEAEFNKFPHQFDKYTITNLIGTGTSSCVFSGINTKTKEEYAFKVISRKLMVESNMMKTLEQELRIVTQLSHPSIVKVYNVIYLTDFIVLVMEYCKGGELFDLLATTGPLSENQIIFYLSNIVDALDYLHKKGLAHRDLKPENIILSDRHPKLIDFGICASTSNLRSTICGSSYYIAPEIYDHGFYDAAKADIWSLGIMAYVMATGTYPWQQDSYINILKKLKDGSITIPPVSNYRIQKFLEKCLVLDPSKRATSAELKMDPLFLKPKCVIKKFDRRSLNISLASIQPKGMQTAKGIVVRPVVSKLTAKPSSMFSIPCFSRP